MRYADFTRNLAQQNRNKLQAGYYNAVLGVLELAADIPVMEMSLDVNLSPADHYALGRKLAPLRQEGVLIMGSGNLAHILSWVDFDSMHGEKYD